MGCTVELSQEIHFNFGKNTYKQKLLIDALLRYSNVDLPWLAQLLDVPVHTLRQVHRGLQVLDAQPSTELARFFLLFFGE